MSVREEALELGGWFFSSGLYPVLRQISLFGCHFMRIFCYGSMSHRPTKRGSSRRS